MSLGLIVVLVIYICILAIVNLALIFDKDGIELPSKEEMTVGELLLIIFLVAPYAISKTKPLQCLKKGVVGFFDYKPFAKKEK